jgi:2-amino-4-hydroxy-6-hydroxymethyldihydropteridine diphosphokinase
MSKSSSSGKRARSAVAALSVGANEGSREQAVLRASYRLDQLPGIRVTRLSALYETEPVGAGFSGSFINAVCIIETDLSPRPLLDRCEALEREFGRLVKGGGDRPLDIDIILYDDFISSEPALLIPHPRYRQRSFVLVPLAETAPDLCDPTDGRRIGEILRGFSGGGWIRAISSRRFIPRTP